MTGARARFGVLVVVIVALLSAGLIGLWAVNRPSTDGPSELARAGIPVSDEDTTLDDPELEEERDEQGEGADERVEAYEQAKEQGKAGQSGKRTYVEGRPGRRPRAGWHLGRRAPDRPRPPTTGSRPSRPTRAPRTSTSSRPATAVQAVPGQLPDAVDRPVASRRRRGDLRRHQAAVRLQGQRPVRPDHRGRAGHRCRLRAVHERLQRPVHEVDRPRRDLVGTGQDLRLGVLERQADHRDERQRPGRLRRLQRPDRRRPMARPVARRRRDVDAGQARRLATATSSPSTATSRPTAPSTSRESSLLYGGGGNKGTTPTGTIDEHVFISRDHGATWIDNLVGQTSRASPARPPAARRTTTSATTPSPSMAAATSSSCTTARRPPAAGSDLRTPLDRRGRPGRRRR